MPSIRRPTFSRLHKQYRVPTGKPLLLRALVPALLCLPACTPPLPWPEAPLYPELTAQPLKTDRASLDAARSALAGRYGHYDVVAYEESLEGAVMRTFVVSYGYTELTLEGDTLVQHDRFCHAEHRLNREGIRSTLNDDATQAIQPRRAPVELTPEGDGWRIHRPATPTLIGITGDPLQQLSRDRSAPNLTDPDGDGNPGITVQVDVNAFIEGQIYLARREIFETHLTLRDNGTLVGHVRDRSEQLVIGASSGLFDADADPKQSDDVGLSPMVLVPVPASMTSCDALMASAAVLFPSPPSFY